MQIVSKYPQKINGVSTQEYYQINDFSICVQMNFKILLVQIKSNTYYLSPNFNFSKE